jgi:transposase
MVLEHAERHATQWKAICAVARQVGCTSEALRRWVRAAEQERTQLAKQPWR